MAVGGALVLNSLLANGTKLLFGVPGESYLPLLDALHDAGTAARFIACRHEGGAAFMAEAYGKFTGRPGVCVVTRGPGATNAAIGVHTAYQDSTPLVVLIGQVSRDHRDREAFQEIDYRTFYGPLTKWVAEVDRPERLPEYLSRASHVAQSGRPGPVALALPEDVLSAEVPASAARPAKPPLAAVGEAAARAALALVERAARPLFIVGGAGWTPQASSDLARFAEANGLPVATAFRRQDAYDNRRASYVGHVGIGIDPALARLIVESDLLVVVGPRLGEMTTGGYTLIEPPYAQQRLIHVFPGADELGHVYAPDLAIPAAPPGFLAAIADRRLAGAERWRERTAAARAAFEAFRQPRANSGELQLAEVVRDLDARLPEDAVLCNGAGNYAAWLHRFFLYKRPRTQLAPTSGAMGYGVPAAIAAKLAAPARTVVALAGDGCFQMTMPELGTAAQYGANIVVLVFNNRMWGTIRMHQERRYPGRAVGSDLVNPDFAALARSYGALGLRAASNGEFAAALDEALAADRPAVIELAVDPDAIGPSQSLAAIRAAAGGARG
jgi:acetolactate synthase-1/2/3 large subunit